MARALSIIGRRLRGDAIPINAMTKPLSRKCGKGAAHTSGDFAGKIGDSAAHCGGDCRSILAGPRLHDPRVMRRPDQTTRSPEHLPPCVELDEPCGVRNESKDIH